MNLQTQIADYINSHSDPKRNDLQQIHERILELYPDARLWFLDGKNSENKVVSNPNIGYGTLTMNYADGSSREFYQVGLSANTSGISVYIMGLKDKTYLSRTYMDTLGKATITGYCIRFKHLKDINQKILESAIKDGFAVLAT